MTDEELNNLLALFKEGSVTNTTLAVSLMQEMEVSDTRRVFIGIFEFLKDEEWVRKLDALTHESKVLRLDVQVLPQVYEYSDNPNYVEIYVRKKYVSMPTLNMDVLALVIKEYIYDCTDGFILDMLDQLLKAYGYE